jgi:aspartyl-tRNA(Asn)/glutamyl-tRNA(Gln) amidotransferase subunit A
MEISMDKKNATELSVLIREKKMKPSEVCQNFISQYEKTNADINAYIFFDKEAVMNDAKKLDDVKITDETSPVFGLPVAIKDNICTKKIPTTCASKMLKNFTPPYDATVIEKLKGAGAIIFGKLNMDEFAMGSGNGVPYTGVVKNPHDLTRTAGGGCGGGGTAWREGAGAGASLGDRAARSRDARG